MAEEVIQHDSKRHYAYRVRDEDLRAEGPVEEGGVARVARPAVDPAPDERVLRRFRVHDQVREVRGRRDHR